MSLEHVKINLIDSFDEAQALMRWLGTVKDGRIAIDTETTGLSPEEDTVRLMQVGAGDQAWAIPAIGWGGLFKDVIDRWDGRYVGHNMQYDVAMLRGSGIHVDVNRCDDTRLMSHVLNSTESTALKVQARKYVDARAADMQSELDDYMKESGYTWATIPITPTGRASAYWIYGGMDTILTDRLHQHHYPLVSSRSPAAYELELKASWVLEKMMRRGMKVDREYTQEQLDKVTAYIDSCTKWVQDTYGCSPGSNVAVANILIKEGYGEYLTERTDSGALSLTEKVLTPLMMLGHPLATTILRRRQAQKVASTFYKRFLEYSTFDGLLHPRINSIGGSGKTIGESGGGLGVRTGRMSMEHPNLQQLSKKSEGNPFSSGVRNCIVPRDEDHRLVMFDFDQVEMRVLAHLSRDPKLIGAFNGGGDFFVTLAQSMFDDPTLEKSDPRRGIVKTLSYGTVYGSGIDKFAEVSGLSIEEAQKMHAMFHRTFPGAKTFGMEIAQTAQATGEREGESYASSELTGRRFYLDEERPYSLMNHVIQGTAAEIMKSALVRAASAGLDQYMVIPVHDEVISDVPKHEMKDFIPAMSEAMNDHDTFRVPITSGAAMGDRWGMKKDI